MSDNYEAHRNDPPEHAGERVPSGNGSETGWSVEARLAYHAPQEVAGVILDDRWRAVRYEPSRIGVPNAASWHRGLHFCGLFDYAAAQALRWWFVAEAQKSPGGGLCLETRLISHKVEYSYSATPQKAHAYVSGEDRSSMMPDWGKKDDAPKAA